MWGGICWWGGYVVGMLCGDYMWYDGVFSLVCVIMGGYGIWGVGMICD